MSGAREAVEPIAELVVDAMLKVHHAFGPGLLEFWNVAPIQDGIKRMVHGL